MSNLKPPPLFLTPQVVRGLLGIGHPKRVAELQVKALADLVDDARKSRGGGKAVTAKREKILNAARATAARLWEDGAFGDAKAVEALILLVRDYPDWTGRLEASLAEERDVLRAMIENSGGGGFSPVTPPQDATGAANASAAPVASGLDAACDASFENDPMPPPAADRRQGSAAGSSLSSPPADALAHPIPQPPITPEAAEPEPVLDSNLAGSGKLSWARRMILTALIEAAEYGKLCPSNSDLAALVGKSDCKVVNDIHKLVEQGLITIDRSQSRISRAITIVASGKTIYSKHWRHNETLAEIDGESSGADRAERPADAVACAKAGTDIQDGAAGRIHRSAGAGNRPRVEPQAARIAEPKLPVSQRRGKPLDRLAERIVALHGMAKPHRLDLNPPKFQAVYGSRIA